MSKPPRIGVFGGTFNPVHMGHLRMAEEVACGLPLDKVLFVPAKIPPHKSGCDLAEPDHRLRMVELAVADNPRFEVCTLELDREGRSYSVDTLATLREQYGEVELWFIMGLDAYRELHTWKEFRRIPELANIVVVRRPAGDDGPPDETGLTPPLGLEREYAAQGPSVLKGAGPNVIRLFDATQLDISSTAIRDALREGKSIKYLVPELVREILEGVPCAPHRTSADSPVAPGRKEAS